LTQRVCAAPQRGASSPDEEAKSGVRRVQDPDVASLHPGYAPWRHPRA
jgi:hypothetical protein